MNLMLLTILFPDFVLVIGGVFALLYFIMAFQKDKPNDDHHSHEHH